MTVTPDAPAPPTEHVAARLSTLDRFLPVWIGLAMVAGLVLGRLVPGLGEGLSTVEVQGVSLPIALGLLVMMYPVLAKVRYDQWLRFVAPLLGILFVLCLMLIAIGSAVA